MHLSRSRALRVAALGLALVACNADRVVAPGTQLRAPGTTQQLAGAAMPSVRIAEFHYDNPSTDANERIEISGPAGTNLSGWQIVRYNGSTASAAVTYTSPAGPTLSGTIANSCNGRGVLVFNYPVDGLQNGTSDGFALVDNNGAVVELLSYEGVFTASNGVAAGMTSTDVGVAETGLASAPPVSSIQRQPDGSWILATAGAVNFGTCNDDNGGVVVTPVPTKVTVAPATPTISQGGTQQFTATVYDQNNAVINGASVTWSSATQSVATINASGLASGVSAGSSTITATSGSASGTATLNVSAYTPPDIRLSEIHYDNGGVDAGETLEIEGPINTQLTGWKIELYDGNGGGVYNTIAVDGLLKGTCNTRGALSIPAPNIQNGSPDGIALIDNNGQLVEFLSYEGAMTATAGVANGQTSRDIGVTEPGNENAGLSLHRSADGLTWSAAATADFGYVNACGGPPPTTISFTGRSNTSDPAIPVGFEGQIFATYKVGGTTTTTTITWSSDTPTIATIDQNGVFRSVSPGTATLRATAEDGTTATINFQMSQGTQSARNYVGNTEFGDPVDNDNSDDFIIRHVEFTSSYNKNLGHPNWVSLHLNSADYGVQDRCNCFTFDPELDAAGFPHLTTADYTGAGGFAGFGIDRGHMARSADRTASDLDNAHTYWFSNIIPQSNAANTGSWADMETYLGNFAKAGKEVYVVSGGAGSIGTLKNEGKIDMPAKMWKVAVIMDGGKGLSDVHSPADVQVIAVIFPNSGTINSDWNAYKTTVDAVEALSGYDLLSRLPDNIEKAIEANDQIPVARVSGPVSGVEGAPLSFDGSASSDPDAGDVLTYAWTFGDGSTGSGAQPSHAYADNGTYTVTLTVTDSKGVNSQASTTATVTNANPVVTAIAGPAGARISTSTSFTVRFTDPGTADKQTIRVNWGDGTQSNGPVETQGQKTYPHVYQQPGFYTITATVTDDDGGVGTGTTMVMVYKSAGSVTSDGVIPGSTSGSTVQMHAAVAHNANATSVSGQFTLTGDQSMPDLTSSSFDYLTVDGTPTFAGTGTLADGRVVRFLVRGFDLSAERQRGADKVRVKVWEASSGSVLYDTNPGSPDTALPSTPITGYFRVTKY